MCVEIYAERNQNMKLMRLGVELSGSKLSCDMLVNWLFCIDDSRI